MGKLIGALFLCSFVTAGAQNSVFLRFDTVDKWSQILVKAKRERKYIFLDYYATWCVPCKTMDKYVYTAKSVIDFANDNFISVKVQADTSQDDNVRIKNWYLDANMLKQQYQVSLFPSFLFFSPEGDIVHRGVAFKDSTKFLQLMKDALDSTKQLYTQLASYRRGQKKYASMIDLTQQVIDVLQDRDLAISIGQDYVYNYLFKLDSAALFTKENAYIMARFIRTTTEPGFKFLYNHTSQLDKAVGWEKFSHNVIDNLIIRNDINPVIYRDTAYSNKYPNWRRLYKMLEKKYDSSYARRNVAVAKMGWFIERKDWNGAARYFFEKTGKEGIDTSSSGEFSNNTFLFTVVFMHINDKKLLLKGSNCIRTYFDLHPFNSTTLDTYANLLYKASLIKESIEWESKALQLSPSDEQIKKALENMKANKPTYLEEGAEWSDASIKRIHKPDGI